MIGLGSIILSAPLERSYGAHTLVQMYTPGKEEREQFNKAQAILCVHSLLADMIQTAKAEILKAGEVLKSYFVITIPFGSS